jgi:hypothetical protein
MSRPAMKIAPETARAVRQIGDRIEAEQDDVDTSPDLTLGRIYGLQEALSILLRAHCDPE